MAMSCSIRYALHSCDRERVLLSRRDLGRITSSLLYLQHYVKYIETMAVQESTTLPIDYQHLIRHSKSLAVGLSEEYLRFEPYLRQAVSMAVGQIVPDFQMIDATARIAREFHVGFFNFSSVAKLRELKMSRVGQLCSVTGTVTRTSEVRPELHFGVFTCKVCAAESEPVEQQFKYTEPVQCRNRGCNNSKEWTLLPERYVRVWICCALPMPLTQLMQHNTNYCAHVLVAPPVQFAVCRLAACARAGKQR